jgi:hypothetical protein
MSSLVKELESITSLLDGANCERLSDSDKNTPTLDHIIEEPSTVTTKQDHTMVAQSLFPNDDSTEQTIPTLTQTLVIPKTKADEQQLVLPPVEELDAELAINQSTNSLKSTMEKQHIDQAVKQCMMELEPIVRDKIIKILTKNNNDSA